MMNPATIRSIRAIAAFTLVAWGAASHADTFSDAERTFKSNGQSGPYFRSSYGYAVFPTIGEGGFVVGGAYGKGRVYVHGEYVGDTSVIELSIGAQAGGQAFSQVIFFANKRAFDRFANGELELDADASAVAVKSSADARVGTTGANLDTTGRNVDGSATAAYHDGLSIFTIVKGGAMLQAAVGGQKFTYAPVSR